MLEAPGKMFLCSTEGKRSGDLTMRRRCQEYVPNLEQNIGNVESDSKSFSVVSYSHYSSCITI